MVDTRVRNASKRANTNTSAKSQSTGVAPSLKYVGCFWRYSRYL